MTAIANNSLHIYSNVTSLSVTTGRVVLEKGSVTTLALSSSASNAVTLEVAENVAVGTLAVQGAAGTVTVENNGVINAITGTAGSTIVVSGSGETATPADGDSSNVVVNGETFVAYDGSDNVFTAENSGSVVKLTADVTTAIVIPEGTTFVLDLNGHNVTVEGTNAILNNGTLTIKGEGTVDALTHAKAALFNAQGATAILNGGTFTRSLAAGTFDPYNNGGNSFYVIQNQGSMTINSDVVVKVTDCYSSMIANGWQDGSKNTSKIEATLVINGGTFTGGLNTLKNDEYGNAFINGGIFTNTVQAVVLNWNAMTINGGHFYAGSNGSSVLYGADGETAVGTLIITGGEFVGSFNPFISGSVNYGSAATITVIGGTFNYDLNSAPAEIVIPDGYTYDSTTGTVSKN